MTARGTTRLVLLAVAVLFPAACSEGSSERAAAEDDAPIVPKGLTVTALQGGNGVLDLVALTLLHEGQGRTELYAALRNDDATILACDPGLSVDLYDNSGQPMGTWIGGLDTRHFYRLADAGTVASCVAPGDVTMAALTDLPADLAIDEVGTVVYRCPYFALNAAPVDGLVVGQMESVSIDVGTAYTGTLVNEFDAAVGNPSVQVFPVNAVGRPLGMATASGTNEIPAGESWQFRTNAVDTSAANYVAYPMATLAY